MAFQFLRLQNGTLVNLDHVMDIVPLDGALKALRFIDGRYESITIYDEAADTTGTDVTAQQLYDVLVSDDRVLNLEQLFAAAKGQESADASGVTLKVTGATLDITAEREAAEDNWTDPSEAPVEGAAAAEDDDVVLETVVVQPAEEEPATAAAQTEIPETAADTPDAEAPAEAAPKPAPKRKPRTTRTARKKSE